MLLIPLACCVLMQVCRGLLTARRLAKLGEGDAELKVDEFINQLSKYKPVDEESDNAIFEFTSKLPHMQPKDTEEGNKEEKVRLSSLMFVHGWLASNATTTVNMQLT